MTQPYTRPQLTDLGNVEELTQLTISFKSSRNGTDVQFSKDGIKEVKGKRGVTFSIGG